MSTILVLMFYCACKAVKHAHILHKLPMSVLLGTVQKKYFEIRNGGQVLEFISVEMVEVLN